jgi:translation initiation factor IF-3
MRVVDEHGQTIGVLTRDEAFALAQEKGLDLIEVTASANPPIVKLINYDKFRYQEEKEQKKQRASQKQNELKQIRITGRAAENDMRIRAKKTDEFLAKDYKVEIMLALRGREKANTAWAFERLTYFLTLINPEHKVTVPPKKGGRGIVMQITKK